MEERNKYREMIVLRKEKERNLMDLLATDKVDFTALEKAIEEAKANLVKEEVIEKAEKQMAFLRFSKEIEQELITAVAEKNGEAMRTLIERIDGEAIAVDAKILADAKTNLAKMK